MLAILKTPAEVRAHRAVLQSRGAPVGLVPTMGYLHEGHVALIREALKRVSEVAVSIFVNPTQFGPTEDLAKYPRDFEGDVAKCAAAGATMVYAPTPEAVYPSGFQTWVEVERASQGMEGASRPGHFRGVATVVTKLLALFRPACAIFGEKDYQQLRVVTQLNADLELGVEIVGLPTVRDTDGLALSSRNKYLSVEDRARATALSRGLFAAQALARGGEARVESLIQAAKAELARELIAPEYVEVRDAETLELLATLTARPARLLVAARVGATRLIDNVPLALVKSRP